MTIDEAIKILSNADYGSRWPWPKPEVKALMLGLEALKRCRVIQQESVLQPFALLPGETKD